MKRYSLGIVQTHATQFDGPLFKRLSRHPDIELTVYYTKPSGKAPFDKEIGQSPDWDTHVTAGYRYETRDTGFSGAVRFILEVVNGNHDLIIISGYLPFYHLLVAVYARLKGVAVGLRSDTTFLYTSQYSAKSILKRLIMPFILRLYSSGHQTGTLAKQCLLQYGFPENRLLRFFSKRGYTKVTGVDVSPEQVKLARQIHPNVIHGDALEFLKGHKEEFDLIAALDFIEHFYKDEIVNFLDACHRVLRLGGVLIIQTPNADSPFGLVCGFGDFTHEVFLNISSLSGVMTVCGFTEIKGREVGPVPYGLFSLPRWILWKLIRLMIMSYNIIETSGPGSNIFSRIFIASGVKQ